MLSLMTAALVAAQPASPANPHAHHAQPQQQGQAAPMQHDGVKKDCCCKECCKHMGKHDDHAPAAHPKRGR